MGDGAAWQTPSLPCPRHQPRAGNPRAPSVTDLGSAKGRSGPGRGTAGDVTNGTRRAESPESPPAAAAGSGGANERARGPAQHASERSPLPKAAAAFSFAVVDARSGCGTVGPVLGAAPAPGLGSQYLPQLFGCYRRSASKMAARGGGWPRHRFRFRCAVCEGKRFSRQFGEGLYCPFPGVPGVSARSWSKYVPPLRKGLLARAQW